MLNPQNVPILAKKGHIAVLDDIALKLHDLLFKAEENVKEG